MILEKAAKDTLSYLFSEYLKGPAIIYGINRIARKYRIDPVEFSDYLSDNGWIRERWIYDNGEVACKISIMGIEQVNPVYVRGKLRQLIGGLGEAGGSKPLINILEHKIAEYSIALDTVRQLEQLGLIEIRYPQDTIVIQLTEEGSRCYKRGSKSFFTLVV
jgi:hypothetical protein